MLADRALREVIDPARPVCVIFDGLGPSLMPAGQAREVVARYAALVAPGSLVALSCWHFADDGLRKQLAAAFTSADLHNHANKDLAVFLGGLELVPPGIATAAGLRPWAISWRSRAGARFRLRAGRGRAQALMLNAGAEARVGMPDGLP